MIQVCIITLITEHYIQIIKIANQSQLLQATRTELIKISCKPKNGMKFRQILHWHRHPFPIQVLIFVLNSVGFIDCLIENRNIQHNCGPLIRTVSEPYITHLTWGKLKSWSFLRLYLLVCGQDISVINGWFSPSFVLMMSLFVYAQRYNPFVHS